MTIDQQAERYIQACLSEGEVPEEDLEALEKLLEEVSFHAPDMDDVIVDVDRAMVQQRLSDIVKDEDLSKYIL